MGSPQGPARAVTVEQKLLLDEMLSGDIAAQLRAKGHDATAVVKDPALVGTPDEELLAHATLNGRCLVTTNIVASAVVASSGKVVRPAAFSSRSTSTTLSSAATGGLAVLPVSGSAAITAGVKVHRYLYRAASRSKWPWSRGSHSSTGRRAATRRGMPTRCRISRPGCSSGTVVSASTARISSGSRARAASALARSTSRCHSSCRARESAPASAWSSSCTSSSNTST